MFFASLLLSGVLFLGAIPDPDEEFSLILTWEEPKNYPRPMLEGLDLDTLSILLDSGNLQWYEPRPVKDRWEAVVGMKVHAPPDVVWEVVTDHELQCEIMPKTFMECKTESREGNKVKTRHKIQTSVIMYSYEIDMIEEIIEDPPYHMHINTVEGGLKGRELDIVLVPIEKNAHTLLFMRYHAYMANMGVAMRAILAVLPMLEPPTAVGAANYHTRAYKNAAEKRAGYVALREPGPLEIENLDLDTLRLIDKGNGGLIRETPEGKIIDVLTWDFIDAPPERVFEVTVDFEHYDEIFPGGSMEVESWEGNEVVVRQKSLAFKVFIFSLGGFELHSRYVLEPPYRLTYTTIDGTYEGSHGEFRIMPLENGNKSLAFAVGGVNIDRDDGLFARMTQSGAFPLENMLNMVGTQTTLAHIRVEAERREAEKKSGAAPK
jgi:carbon monoxide dehydrogenase subunit G